MKIAATINDMYDATASIPEAIRAYGHSGFRCLDFSFFSALTHRNGTLMTDRWKESILECKAVAESFGMSFVQAHAPVCAIHGEGSDVGLEATLRSIEACGMLGVHNMVIHSGFFPEYKYPDGAQGYFAANAPFFRALIPAMEKYEVNILFENTTIKHCREGCYFPIYAKDVNALVAYMDHPLFGAGWDVGHAHIDGIDQYAEIQALGGNLRAIHVHDNDGTCDQHLAPFQGTMDYDALLRGLIDVGYKGYFTLETDNFFRYNRSSKLSGPLAHPPLAVKTQALSLLYTICKEMLLAYGIYEE